MTVLKYSFHLLLRCTSKLSPKFHGVNKFNILRPGASFCSSVSTNELIAEKYSLKFNGSQVEVKDPSWDKSISLPFIWLRDHCRCPKCYNHATHQRALDLMSIPDEIYPASCSLQNGSLRIKWPDDHTSEYPMDWLWKTSYEGHSHLASEGPSVPVSWDGSPDSVQHIAKVPLANYLNPTMSGKVTKADQATPGLVEVVRSLIKYGVAFVNDVHPSMEGTQQVVDQLALIKHTLFGGMFEFGDGMDHADTAYTNQYIGPHTDNTYFKEAAGLLVLHCIHHEGVGGDNFLVDGLHAAEVLKLKYPEAHACLVEEETEAQYIDADNGQHYSLCGPILRYRKDTGQFVQLRFNLYDRAPLSSLPPDRIPKFYSSLKLLAKELQNPKVALQFKLTPGTVMLVDNWRVLHGRNEYTGRRKMTGCYIDRGDYESTARILGLL